MGEGREAGTEDLLVTHPLSTVFYFPFTEQQTPFLTTTVFHHSRENYTLRKLNSDHRLNRDELTQGSDADSGQPHKAELFF